MKSCKHGNSQDSVPEQSPDAPVRAESWIRGVLLRGKRRAVKNEGEKMKCPVGGRAGDRPCLGALAPVQSVRMNVGLETETGGVSSENKSGTSLGAPWSGVWGLRGTRFRPSVEILLLIAQSIVGGHRCPQESTYLWTRSQLESKGQPWPSHPFTITGLRSCF